VRVDRGESMIAFVFRTLPSHREKTIEKQDILNALNSKEMLAFIHALTRRWRPKLNGTPEK
jgi:hypothetical protein